LITTVPSFQVLKWKYRKKLGKISKKFFGCEINAENFRKYDSYKLLLYRKESP